MAKASQQLDRRELALWVPVEDTTSTKPKKVTMTGKKMPRVTGDEFGFPKARAKENMARTRVRVMAKAKARKSRVNKQEAKFQSKCHLPLTQVSLHMVSLQGLLLQQPQ